MTLQSQFALNLWKRQLGMREDWSWLEKTEVPSYERLLESEWDEVFWQLCLRSFNFPEDFRKFKEYARNRMIMGSMRYGTLASKNFLDYNHQGNFIKRMELGDSAGNLECFVDAYNIAYLQYLCKGGDHAIANARYAMSSYDLRRNNPRWSFDAQDDGEHCVKKEEL